MATSPDFLRLAASASRALAETALDSLRDSVLVIDARHKLVPLVLANAAARRCLCSAADEATLIESPLARVLGSASAALVDPLISCLVESKVPVSRLLTWRFIQGEQSVLTDIKLLDLGAAQRLVMLSFTPPPAHPDLVSAMDQLPFDILILDPDLKVTYANAGAVRSAGAIPGGVLGCSALMLAPTMLLQPEVFARVLAGGMFHDESLVLAETGRITRRFEIDMHPLNGAAGIVGLLVLCLEVTEGHAGKRTYGKGERRLLALTEHALDIITIADADGRLQYVSGGVQNSLGYTSEERQSNLLFEHAHADDREELLGKFRQLVKGDIKSFSREYRMRHKDGSFRWLESRCVSAFANPLINGVVINSRDITERKQAEFRLAQREEVFRLAAEAVDGVIFEWDVARNVVHRSHAVQEVLGLAPEELESSVDGWLARIHPRDFSAAKRALSMGLMSGRGWTTAYRIRDAKGRYRSILDRALVQRNHAGDPVRVIGCCVDVSEIKRLTDILDESQRIAKIGGWEYSYATRELTWTDEMFRIYGTNAQEFHVSWDSMLAQCVPESTAQLREAFRRAEAGSGHVDLEIEINSLKDQRIWVRIIGHLEMLGGRPFRAFGSVQNIQAKKLVQIQLENSTGWLKLSMNMANMHAWRWDKAQNSFEFANLDEPQVHLSSVYPDMETMLARVHPKDQRAVRRAVDLAFSGPGEVRQEFELLGIDGRYRSYATTARPLYEGDMPRGLVGVIQDVTARRDSERRLRRSEELLRVTTANTADTLVLLDTTLCVRFINKGVNELTADEIIGRDIGALLPAAARMGVLQKLARILETGQTATFEFESIEKGQPHYFENCAVVVRDRGVATGISISMRDITERKGLEQEILDVSGRERQSIGRDLHDGLGQELTGVALMLRGLAGRITERCPDVVQNVNEIVGHVNQSIETARSLAWGLLPVRTETGGLSAALRALAARSRDLYGLEVHFHSQLSREFVLTETNASHLYRITQEALTNASRHGRASLVDISLTGEVKGFMLRITDNGVGLAQSAPSASGMGLKIMKYRADMIGAKFDIAAYEPHGAVVTVAG